MWSWLTIYTVWIASYVVQWAKNLPAMQETQETQVQSLGGGDTCRRVQQLTPVFLPGEPHGQRSLAGYSPWGHRRVGNDWSDVACTILIKLFSHTVFHLPYWMGHFLDLTLVLWALWIYSFHITIHLGGNVLFMHLWICFPLLKIDLKRITLIDIQFSQYSNAKW